MVTAGRGRPRSISGWADTSRPTSPTGQAARCRFSRGRTHEGSAATHEDRARRRPRGLRDGHCRSRADWWDRKGKLGIQAVVHRGGERKSDPPDAATGAPAERCSCLRASFAACRARGASVLSTRRRSRALLRGRRRTLAGDVRRRSVLGRFGTVDGPLRRRPLERQSERDEVLPGRRNRRRPSVERRRPRLERRRRGTCAGRRQCLRHAYAARCSRARPRRIG
jgi:hypothetical protein